MVKKALLKLLRIAATIFLIILLFVLIILLRNEFKRINQVKEFTKNNPDIVQLCKNKYQSNIYYYKYKGPNIYTFKVKEKLFLKYNSKKLSERDLYKEIVIELINAGDKHFLKIWVNTTMNLRLSLNMVKNGKIHITILFIKMKQVGLLNNSSKIIIKNRKQYMNINVLVYRNNDYFVHKIA